MLTERLRERQRPLIASDGKADTPANVETLNQGVIQFSEVFDKQYGGFGTAPKFPRPSELLFLLREHVRSGDRQALLMVVETLRAIGDGGLRDHVGGGFHCYSVDDQRRVPHVEKMLYDQAQLALAYLEAGQLISVLHFLDGAAHTLSYVAGDLTGPEGVFFSAEDADSVELDQSSGQSAVKFEGAFYLWTQAEVRKLLEAEAKVVLLRYGVGPDGNSLQEPMGELQGKNQLYAACSIEEVSRLTGRSEADVSAVLEEAVGSLFDRRARRPRPHLDDKVLAAWNGLIIAALARAAFVFESEPQDGAGGTVEVETRAEVVLKRAQRAAQFIRRRMWDSEQDVLFRRYRDGRASIGGYTEDDAFLVWGLLELFQVDGDVGWFRWALELQRRQDELFWDQDEGGWFSTTGTDPSVLLRMKDDYDGAEPSG